SAWAVTMGAGATMGSCMRHLPFHAGGGRGSEGITWTPAMAKYNSRDDYQSCLYSWMCLMPGPSPIYRPCFPLAFLEQARQMVRQRTIKFQLRQRAVLVLLLHEQPLLSNVEAGRWAQLHPDSVRHWRRRWTQRDFSLEDEPGRGR